MGDRIPVKQELLDVLKKEGKITIQEIMRHFSISEVAVRRHLHDLEQQGFVKRHTVKQELGRPYHTYELTAAGHNTFPNQYEQLPVDLLNDLEELEGKETVNKLITKRMEREKSEFTEAISASNLDSKIHQFAEIKDAKGYMVELNKIDDGYYEMRHYNCPIVNLASAYKQVCTSEQMMYQDFFAECEVKSHSCITEGESCCKWTVKAR